MGSGLSLWAERKYHLNKMTLRELLFAYFTHHSILIYFALIAVSLWLAASLAASSGPPLLAALVIILIYPLVEYLLHRYVLHSRLLYRYKATAALWKRVHYDHHQNPERSQGPVRRALHHAADDLCHRHAPRLADRRLGRQCGRLRHRAHPVLALRILSLRAASAVHAQI